MEKINNLIEKTAVKNMKNKTVVSEFSFLLAIFIILKLLTSFVSIVAGFSYLKNLIIQITQNKFLSVVIAIIALITVEFITQISLQRMFKFILKRQVKYIVLMVAVVMLFFSLSSYISMEGIGILTSQKKDLTSEIVQKYKLIADQTKTDYTDKINYQKQQIDLIKKQTWHGKLSQSYINKITAINDKILQLEAEQKQALNKIETEKQKELNNNKINTKQAVNKYVWVVFAIMLIQLISNLFLNYFYLLILKEKNEYLDDFVKTEQAEIRGNIIDLYKSMFILNSDTILQGLQRGVIENRQLVAEANKPSQKVPKNEPKIGFNIYDNNINENRINENRITKQKETKQTANKGTKICPNCGKEYIPHHHKQIYCSDACRIDFWEKKTGKKLKLKPKK